MLIVVLVIGFIILYRFIGYNILMPMYIPDYCYYHSHKPSTLVNILFDFPSAAGYHPVPTYWGYLIFGVIGGLLGRCINRKLFHKQ